MANISINIRMDAKCAECRKPGATDSGLCLGCTSKAMHAKPLRSEIGRAVQRRIHERLQSSSGKSPFQVIGSALDAATKK